MVWLAVRAAVIRALIPGLAFSNAALREPVLIPRSGKMQGLTLSGVVLALLVLLVTAIAPCLAARLRGWV